MCLPTARQVTKLYRDQVEQESICSAQHVRPGRIPDPSRSLAAGGRVRRVRIGHEETGQKVVMTKSRGEQARCITHLPPQTASFLRLGPQQGMVGRTDPSPAREPPECHDGMDQ